MVPAYFKGFYYEKCKLINFFYHLNRHACAIKPPRPYMPHV